MQRVGDDLVGKLNQGWTVGKRLLQHERSSLSGMGGGGARGRYDHMGELHEIGKPTVSDTCNPANHS